MSLVLRALVAIMPRAPRALVPHVPRALCTLVTHVSRVLCGLVPHVLHALPSLLPHVPRALRAFLPQVLRAPRAVVAQMLSFSCLSWPFYFMSSPFMPVSPFLLLFSHASRDSFLFISNSFELFGIYYS